MNLISENTRTILLPTAFSAVAAVFVGIGPVAAIVGPLVFSFVYEMAEPDHMGVVWLIGAGLCLVGVVVVGRGRLHKQPPSVRSR